MDVGAGNSRGCSHGMLHLVNHEGYTSIELVTRHIECAPWRLSNAFRPFTIVEYPPPKSRLIRCLPPLKSIHPCKISTHQENSVIFPEFIL